MCGAVRCQYQQRKQVVNMAVGLMRERAGERAPLGAAENRREVVSKLPCHTLSDAMATRLATGLPPYVDPCCPRPMVSITSLLASTAETGMVPPDSALPRIVMSGLAPPMSHSLHSILPVLRR